NGDRHRCYRRPVENTGRILIGLKQGLHPPTNFRIRRALALQNGGSRGRVGGLKSRLEHGLHTLSVHGHVGTPIGLTYSAPFLAAAAAESRKKSRRLQSFRKPGLGVVPLCPCLVHGYL